MTVPVYISEETRAQLARLAPDTIIPLTVQFNNVTVGVCTSDIPPQELILPGGLTWEPSPDVTAGTLASSSQAADFLAQNVITLRMHARFPLRRSVDAVIKLIESPTLSLITIDGLPLMNNALLSETIDVNSNDDVVEIEQHAHSVDIYYLSCADEDIEKEGPVFNYITTAIAEKDHTVDVITHVFAESTATDVRSAISHSILRQINAVSYKSFISQRHEMRACHFPVFGAGLGVTYLSPSYSTATEEISDKSNAQRLSLHRVLALPENRPLLRSSCVSFQPLSKTKISTKAFDGGHSGRLSDVHVGLKPPIPSLGTASDVTLHLIDGHYLYSHYQQDHIDDSGWGCAYRSLQTILSWCINERYISLPSPNTLTSHTDIQRALVFVDDKPSSFIGSREWIGANEVCYALEHLSGVQSRIIHVSSGSLVASERGREFAKHFDTQGSPIMVGGGVLAWTMLGIARNEVTGKCQFLILDPHYEGRDALENIQGKGWVAWKTDDIFDASAFYNFCLPQRPMSV